MDGVYALILSILKGWTPEQSFLYIETGKKVEKRRNDITPKDVEDMVSLQKQGLTYRQIAECYHASKDLVRRRIKRFLKKQDG